ncbi:thioesterase [Mycobacteroides saopaulense]|uniref:PaaI family thioesterase n=1 Tax=Mycobacteroides saopaulense TaxID=1578165 RepID=UPI0007226FA8|nr:PaaI family thioesterase [Mycobacteroides saopaulense]ALR13304.1 thioesterase [Mycobacteroides saopaulense]
MTADGDRLAALHEEMNRAIREIEGEHSGGFPQYSPSSVGPGFGRFLTAMRRLQDLAVSADMEDPRWDEAADLTEKLVELMDPYESPEGVGPANRVADEPANGHLLLPPWFIDKAGPDGIEAHGDFPRFYLGGNGAVHGGILPLLFDHLFGMTVIMAGRTISRTAFLHVNYREVVPVGVPLTASSRIDEVDRRKAFVSAELYDAHGTVLADANGLMVQLLPGQP